MRRFDSVESLKESKQLYKTIKEVNSSTLIIKYKGEEEEITKTNVVRVAVKAKHTLLNYTEAILSFLWEIHVYFSNEQSNRK